MNLLFHLINGLLDFGFLSFSTSKDEIGPEGPDELQLLPQAVRLRLDGLDQEHHSLNVHLVFVCPDPRR